MRLCGARAAQGRAITRCTLCNRVYVRLLCFQGAADEARSVTQVGAYRYGSLTTKGLQRISILSMHPGTVTRAQAGVQLQGCAGPPR